MDLHRCSRKNGGSYLLNFSFPILAGDPRPVKAWKTHPWCKFSALLLCQTLFRGSTHENVRLRDHDVSAEAHPNSWNPGIILRTLQSSFWSMAGRILRVWMWSDTRKSITLSLRQLFCWQDQLFALFSDVFAAAKRKRTLRKIEWLINTLRKNQDRVSSKHRKFRNRTSAKINFSSE